MTAPVTVKLSDFLSAGVPPARPRVSGKFLFAGDQKLYVRGVTYGSFRPSQNGEEFPDRDVVAQDFAQMASNGLNAVRTYTVPPRWILDLALKHQLWVMVGLPWEQHIAFLDDRNRRNSILQRVRDGLRACAGHPAVLCYALGNEIPAPIVRWHGARRVEKFIRQLYESARFEDPQGLFTYVNYPSTEYLNLPFLDFVCFNVYLEEPDKLEAYLARLQNLAGDRPLVMAEIGLDSRRNGELCQAATLDWQIRTTFAAGCAGAFVFAWTDEWFRGGFDIEDWDFGLTTRDRHPKPALALVRKAFDEVPFPADLPWPRISVVVCSYNGSRTIRECLEGLSKLEYPDFEIIVVNDGSTDDTEAIARQFNVRLISTANRGLSRARNTGMQAATGEIVAYIDDDAYPDPHWLTYLAASFLKTDHAGIGGPNIAPPNDGHVAHCVAQAPGNPVHILLSDREAEHIPGCNMAFRKRNLEAISGFDAQFRAAGDDVDVCWRLQERGWTLGFSPAAMVWHHRRNSMRAYWKQQRGYGKAEGLLERKWPEKYNTIGHLSWQGRVYGNGFQHLTDRRRARIYQGSWGNALFQSIYQPGPSGLRSLSMMPEWYLIGFALAAIAPLGFLWKPLFLALPLVAITLGVVIHQALVSAARSLSHTKSRAWLERVKLHGITTVLYLSQPMARLRGRLSCGLTPWRRYGIHGLAMPWPRNFTIWSEHWQSSTAWLERCEAHLRARGAVVRRGGDFDRWDLEVRGGLFSNVRLLGTIEEHGGGKQLVRFRTWGTSSPMRLAVPLMFIAVALGAASNKAWTASVMLTLMSVVLAIRVFRESAVATGVVLRALNLMRRETEECVLDHDQPTLERDEVVTIRPVISPGDQSVGPAPLAAGFNQVVAERISNIRSNHMSRAPAAAARSSSG